MDELENTKQQPQVDPNDSQAQDNDKRQLNNNPTAGQTKDQPLRKSVAESQDQKLQRKSSIAVSNFRAKRTVTMRLDKKA